MQCRCGWTQLSSPTTPVFYTARKTDIDAFATGQSTLLAASTAAGEDASRDFCSLHPDGHKPEAVTRQPTAEGEAAITPSAPELRSAEPGAEDDMKEDDRFLIHKINEQDTLMRLSVHYNVTEHSIKRANQFQLLGNHLDHLHGKLIRIPRVHGYIEAPAIDPARAAADERQRVIRTFQREAQCTEHEANYYLLDAEWNTALALQTLYADREWAAANPQTAAGRRPTTYVISPDGTRMVPSVIGGDAQKAAENAASGETACNDCE